MKKIALVLSILACAAPAHGFEYWNGIRHSALFPGGDIVIRAENPSGVGIENYLLYANAGIVEAAMIPILDGPATLEATAPGPGATTRFYGFRLIQGAEIDLMPVRIADGASPAPADLTRIASDPAGDHLYGYVNLDLVDCRVSFSGTKLFAALTNAGGGFPVNQGLTFFGYLLAVANPALADPDTVFALMHTYNQPGIISPGLYKITGPDFGDLVKIGNVTVQTFSAENTLLISCDLADLMADPYFMSWYDPSDPALGVAGFTQRIALLGGAAEADRTPGGRCWLRELAIAPIANQPPVLSSLSFEGTGAEAYARIDYSDPNGHCPVVAEISFDGGAPFRMYPRSLGYGAPVEYRTAAGIEPLANDTWYRAVARFSDNTTDTIEVVATTTGIADDEGVSTPPALRAMIAPNPFSGTASFEIETTVDGTVRVEIFDVRGAVVRTVLSGSIRAGARRIAWDGRDAKGMLSPSGLYLCRISSGGRAITQKLLLIR